MTRSIKRSRVTRFRGRETGRECALEGTVLAGFAQRAASYVIDVALAVALWGPLEVGWRIFVLRQTDVHVVWDFHEVGNVAVLLLYHGLFNYFGNGRTPGKWIARTRAVSLTHERMGPWQSVERALGYGAAVLELGLGFIQFFWSENRMCAQDRLAETVVIDTRRRSMPD